MFRRDKESKLDNEGLRRMREAIRQRLEQEEQAPADAGGASDEGYPQPTDDEPTYVATGGYQRLTTEPGYSFLGTGAEERGAVPIEPAIPASTSQVPEPAWDAQPAIPPTTTIGAETTWQGTLRSTASIRVEGTLEGEVETEQELYVAQDGRIDATVRANTIVVAGNLTGQITCHDRLEVLPSGHVSGQIDAGAIVVHEGAFLGGQLRMHSAGERQEALGSGAAESARPMLQRVR